MPLRPCTPDQWCPLRSCAPASRCVEPSPGGPGSRAAVTTEGTCRHPYPHRTPVPPADPAESRVAEGRTREGSGIVVEEITEQAREGGGLSPVRPRKGRGTGRQERKSSTSLTRHTGSLLVGEVGVLGVDSEGWDESSRGGEGPSEGPDPLDTTRSLAVEVPRTTARVRPTSLQGGFSTSCRPPKGRFGCRERVYSTSPGVRSQSRRFG